MKQSASVQKQLHDSRMSLLRSNVQRRQTLAVTFVDDESSFFRIEQLLYCVKSPVASCKVQWGLVVVVLEVYARAELDQVLERPNVPFPRGVVQWRAAGVVFFVEEVTETEL